MENIVHIKETQRAALLWIIATLSSCSINAETLAFFSPLQTTYPQASLRLIWSSIHGQQHGAEQSLGSTP